MDNKNKARLMRELADKEDEAASLCAALGWCGLEGLHQSDAEHHRLQADKLDPPQPEWKEGDLVRDRYNRLWEYNGALWYSRGFGGYNTKLLNGENGPLRKVYVSDPAKQEVVVNVKDIYLKALLTQADKDEQEESSLTIAGIRVAKAVRDQLAGSEPSGDGA